LNIEFSNKVALVTGGTRGIGLRCAEMLAEGGAKVAVIGRDKNTLDKALESIGKYGTARGYSMDVTQIGLIEETVKQIINDLNKVDILVCSAGANLGKPRPAETITEPEWDKVYNTNIKSLFFFNKSVAVHSMIPRKRGVIINISSQSSIIAPYYAAPYCSSKAAVNHLTKAEAKDWAAHNIRVNAVAPTWTLTELSKSVLESSATFATVELGKIPLKRFATLDDVASAVCFLASEAAGYITGVSLPVDGGYST
jgi:NAD(P)-dependent dehydrogenase (short-subunit alcohol dehydrogenase family)